MGESVLTRCPRTPFDVICREDPTLRFPASCDTWACSWCGPALARRRARCLAWARPERFATLTNAPTDWQACRQKVRKLALRLRRDGYSVEWAWTVEAGSKTGMRHVHALQHGDFVPQRYLQERWGAIVHIEAIKGAHGAANYALKEASQVAGYAVKETSRNLAAHLERNGGRAYHLSRRYLHGRSTREVERLVANVDETRTWVVVPADTPIAAGVAIAALG